MDKKDGIYANPFVRNSAGKVLRGAATLKAAACEEVKTRSQNGCGFEDA